MQTTIIYLTTAHLHGLFEAAKFRWLGGRGGKIQIKSMLTLQHEGGMNLIQALRWQASIYERVWAISLILTYKLSKPRPFCNGRGYVINLLFCKISETFRKVVPNGISSMPHNQPFGHCLNFAPQCYEINTCGPVRYIYLQGFQVIFGRLFPYQAPLRIENSHMLRRSIPPKFTVP